MNKKQDSFTSLLVCAFLFLILLSLICICKAESISSNKASILGGVLGAIATAVLGFIAFWQNKRYKELSDNYSERAFMPEIYKPDSLRDTLKSYQKSTYNSMTFSIITDKETRKIDCGRFLVLNAPILLIHVKSISQGNNILYFDGHSRSLYDNDGFALYLEIPEAFFMSNVRYLIVFEYENIYGTKYEKTASFTLGDRSNYALSWKLDKASRCDINIDMKESDGWRLLKLAKNVSNNKDRFSQRVTSTHNWHDKLSSNKVVIIWALCSALFALTIHILFKIKNGPEWLKAEWEAGDILTYASTVALGLLALWQNKRFKEENDISQARLEKLTEQANEQTIINKIIEIESEKLSETKKAISIFSDICDPVLNFPNMFAGQLNSEQELHERFYMCAIQKRKIDESFSELFRTLNVDSNTENRFAHRFLADATKYKNAVEIAIQKISRMSHDVEAMISDKELESLHTIRNEFDESRNDFICHREELLRQIIYDNLSKDVIKDLIKDEYASYKELVED